MTGGLRTRAAKATWWSGLEISVRYGAQFVVMVVLARLLPAETFGLIAMLLVFTSLASLLIDSGFGVALVQRADVTEDHETTVFFFSMATGVLVALALWTGAHTIAAFYEEPRLAPMLQALSLVLPFNALATVPDALLTKRLDFRARTSAELAGSLASGVIAIVLALRGYGAWSLVVQAVASSGIRTSMLWVLSGWRPRGQFSRASLGHLFGFGGYMLLTNLLDTVTIRLQAVLIGKLFDPTTLGYFTIAQNTQQAPASFFGSVLNRVGLPVFSSVAHDPETLREALRASLRVSMYLFVPCMLGIAVVAGPLVTLLYGARWAPAAPILSILAFASVFWPLHVLNLAAIGAQGRSDLFFKLAVVKKIVAITLIVAASPFGPVAIAWATLVASIVAIAVNTHYTAKLLGYGIAAQLQDMTNTLAGALAACATGFVLLHFHPPSLGATCMAIFSAAAVYLAWGALTHSLAMREVFDIARRVRAGARTAPAQTVEPP